jgi:Luciferase-like monooxygenase
VEKRTSVAILAACRLRLTVKEAPVRYGFVIPGGDVPDIVEVAAEIEAAGWDAVFVAEFLYGVDAWVTLGAMAARTERVRLGTLLTPPSRRRPWKLASEVATLDRLSGGRALLPVGLGALDTGFAEVGEATDRKQRAALMDECLELLTRFWAGQPFSFQGNHYRVDWTNRGDTWAYTPVQTPRVPIWAVALWPNEVSMRRPLRYDGVLPTKRRLPDGTWLSPTPEDVRAIARYAAEHRTQATPFDIVIEGVTPTDDPGRWPDTLGPLAEAGATWWIESMWETPGGMDAVRARIAQGPPRIE